MHILAAIGSKKLMLAGVVISILIAEAEARGWQWWHAIAVSAVTVGYCVAQGIVDGLAAHGLKREPETK